MTYFVYFFLFLCLFTLIHRLGQEGVNLTGEYYTSGSDYQNASNFIWCSANGSAFASSGISWGSGEPSVVNAFGFEEDCVSILLSTGVTKNNYISDVNCADSYKFVCEVSGIIVL